MDGMFSFFLLLGVMDSVTSLPLDLSLELSPLGMNGFETDTNTLNMLKEIEESHQADTDASEPEGTFSRIIQVNKGYNMTVQEGDIVIKTGRSATTCSSCLWPKSADGTVPVPYTLSPDYNDNHISFFRTSMQEYEALTCVRFIPQTSETAFLNIVSSEGCHSLIGRTGGGQKVGIDIDGCMLRGIIQHELNHALGFYHEHMRSDRDDYVNIMFQYISPGDKGNFAKADTNNLGLEYDYGSVMHYDKYAFSNTPNQPTIVPKPDPTVRMGQRNGMSILDVSKINRLYQCNVCGYLLNNMNGILNSANYPSAYPNDASCVWLIRSPSGQATLKFNAFDVQSSLNCVSDYVKIYDGPSRTSPVLLDKTCGTGMIPLLVASTNQMLVEFVSDSRITGVGFKATYSSVPCGGNFFASKKTFTSPGYPNAYPPNMDCTFNITAPVGQRIALTVSDFHVENGNSCIYDYMEVKFGSAFFGPFCGNRDISPITSTGNSLVMTFHSDESNQLKGFTASYTFI